MKSLEQAVKDLVAWHEAGGIGNFTTSRVPRRDEVFTILEQTIKVHEMDEDTADAAKTAFDLLGGSRAEFFANSDGELDRVKVSRLI